MVFILPLISDAVRIKLRFQNNRVHTGRFTKFKSTFQWKCLINVRLLCCYEVNRGIHIFCRMKNDIFYTPEIPVCVFI